MPPQSALQVINQLTERKLKVWVDGGWGVDALVGHQTRTHQDLDIAVLLNQIEPVVATLAELGYRTQQDELPTRLELRDPQDHRVDLHPLMLDRHGNGRQQIQDGRFGIYTATGLMGKGRIGSQTVACLTRELQLDFHTGYELGPTDRHDIELLRSLPASTTD